MTPSLRPHFSIPLPLFPDFIYLPLVVLGTEEGKHRRSQAPSPSAFTPHNIHKNLVHSVSQRPISLIFLPPLEWASTRGGEWPCRVHQSRAQVVGCGSRIQTPMGLAAGREAAPPLRSHDRYSSQGGHCPQGGHLAWSLGISRDVSVCVTVSLIKCWKKRSCGFMCFDTEKCAQDRGKVSKAHIRKQSYFLFGNKKWPAGHITKGSSRYLGKNRVWRRMGFETVVDLCFCFCGA